MDCHGPWPRICGCRGLEDRWNSQHIGRLAYALRHMDVNAWPMPASTTACSCIRSSSEGNCTFGHIQVCVARIPARTSDMLVPSIFRSATARCCRPSLANLSAGGLGSIRIWLRNRLASLQHILFGCRVFHAAAHACSASVELHVNGIILKLIPPRAQLLCIQFSPEPQKVLPRVNQWHLVGMVAQVFSNVPGRLSCLSELMHLML